MINSKMIRNIFLGFIKIHILHHAEKEEIYGAWMMEELKSHGYCISFGTLYPTLHKLEKEGYLKSRKEVVGGRVRKYYSITQEGRDALEKAKEKIRELVGEVME